jgi:hypothetical protein
MHAIEINHEIEFLRGQISAHSYVDISSARDVHVLRLRKTFERAGLEKKFRFSLKILDLMREVQNLGNGYWRITPLRVVPINNFAILISSLPTNELLRHFKSVREEGYARIISSSEISGLPRQDIDSWLGLSVQDTIAWCSDLIKSTSQSMQTTIDPSVTQFYTVRSARVCNTAVNEPKWVDDPRFSLVWHNGIVLCRERIARESYRYFFGKLRNNKLVAESLILNNVTRVIYGYTALMGKPITIVKYSKNGITSFHISTNLPRPEWQLLLALGIRKGKGFRVNLEESVSLISEKLHQLGCEIRTIRD